MDGTAFVGESSWRLCSRCQTLVYGGGSRGVCVDGPHDPIDSPLYGAPTEAPSEFAHAGWRRCARCHELTFGRDDVGDGLCVGGVPHDITGSMLYIVAVEPSSAEPTDPPPPS